MAKYVVYVEFWDGSIHEIEIEADDIERALDGATPKSMRAFELEE